MSIARPTKTSNFLEKSIRFISRGFVLVSLIAWICYGLYAFVRSMPWWVSVWVLIFAIACLGMVELDTDETHEQA